jgi:hypothetical protein
MGCAVLLFTHPSIQLPFVDPTNSYRWRRTLGAPPAPKVDENSVRAARDRQHQLNMLKSRQNKKKVDEKKRDELLNKKKKTKAVGFTPGDNPFEGGALGGFGAGGGASYRPSGGMRRQGGGG